MRTLVLVDGEHLPPVVRAALGRLPQRFPDCVVVAAALLGGTEKLGASPLDLGVPLVTGASPEEVLTAALAEHHPDAVVDLSDEPVLDDRRRLHLAARALAAGAAYIGSDFRLDPPVRPRIAGKPCIAVIGTGKRAGKTAVSVSLARHLATRGTPPVVVAMGRGGPDAPELIDPDHFDFSVGGLLALAASGRHAASDHIENALMAGVATVGTRRCGGGLAGAPFDDTFAAGMALAGSRPERVLVLDGSGRAIPPAHADATVCVVPAAADPELVFGYLGAYRLLLSDVVVITMADEPLAPSGESEAVEVSSRASQLEFRIRTLVPGVRVVHTTFRPTPIVPVSGRRVAFVTTAPSRASPSLREHLEGEHGATITGMSHHLANRTLLMADLDEMAKADVLLVELKAAAVDVVARHAVDRGMELVFCDNRLVSVGGDASFEKLTEETIDLAWHRFRSAATVHSTT